MRDDRGTVDHSIGRHASSDVVGDDPRPGVVGEVEEADEDIVSLVRSCEYDEAIRLLMTRHGNRVYSYCMTELRDRFLADEAHQRTFIQAHRGFPSFAGRSSLRSWLFGIAKNRIRDARRPTVLSANTRSLQEGDDLVHDPGAFVPERLDDARLIAALRSCLDSLPPRTRTAVLLRHQQSLSFEELSQLERDRPGTLQARVARALTTLRRCIEKRVRVRS